MSRSNNSGSNTSGRGGYAPPLQQAQPQQAGVQWRHPLDMEEAVQPAVQPASPPPQWAQPHQPQPDPYAAAHVDPQHYAPQYAPVPQQHYGHQPAHPQQGYEQHPVHQPQADYGHQQDAYGRGGLASYSPQPAQDLSTFAPPPQWPQPPAHDPRGGYDLGEYAPGLSPPAAHARATHPPAAHVNAEPAFSHDPYARLAPRAQAGGWQQQPAQAYQQEPSFGPPSFGPPGGYAESPTHPHAPMAAPALPTSHVQSPTLAPDPFRQSHAAAPVQPPMLPAGVKQQGPDAVDEMEFEEEEDETPRRGRTLLVVGALVGAIFVGGGLAYTYRALSGGGKTPILTADKSAVKTKANTAGKVPDQAPRIPDVAPKTQVASESESTGPRRVATIPVGPDGNAQPPPAPPPLAQPQTITMPGLTVTLPPPVPQREAQLPPQQPSAPPVVRQQPAPPPVVQAPVQPKVITPPQPQKQAALPDVQPPKEKRAVKQKEADAYSPGAPSSAAPGSGVTSVPPAGGSKSALGAGGGGNGFVAAILSTPKGKMEAMKSFADLQAKFPDVLGGKPAEVQEVNLGEAKGVWYRAVVGPPGSRSAAAAVCEQLKTAGYTQCFATAY